jgi:thiol-disulfide isomerase/thioredoxin
MTRCSILAAAGLAFLSSAALAQDQGWVPITTQPVAATPKAKADKKPVYDETADAKQQIAAALAKAKKDNTRVFIQWGGNWCPWCIALHDNVLTSKDVAKELLYEYQTVFVDTSGAGHPTKNVDLAESYGADLKKHGYPFLTVLDSNGKVLANQETVFFELKGDDGKSLMLNNGGGHDAAKVLAFLKEHETSRLQADAVLKDATDQAKASGKTVFLHFGAPWCGWCHRLENWMARPDVAPLLEKDFVDVKIDQDRMIGGMELETKTGMPKNSGIPWFVFINPADGGHIADSTGTDANGKPANIGFPSEDNEIQHFMGMVEKAHKNLTAADLEHLKASLIEEHQKTTAAAH